MIISHGRKYIFVHIPKTGGTSLSLVLEDKAKKDDILIGDTPKAKKRRSRLRTANASGRLWKHSRLTDVYGLVTQEEIEQYFVFTIVRNPWDRMVSYYHWLKEQSFDHPAVGIANESNFKAFLSDVMIQQSLRNDASLNYVCDANGKDCCNKYLRLENLSQDVVNLGKNLHLNLADLPYQNKSDRGENYAEYYDKQSKDIVGVAYAEDIEKFGYRF